MAQHWSNLLNDGHLCPLLFIVGDFMHVNGYFSPTNSNFNAYNYKNLV